MGGNFKKGSGSLDFEEDESSSEEATAADQSSEDSHDAEESTPQSASGGSVEESPSSKYPYFVRRSSVTDERDNRLEIHIRDEVAEREGEYRSALAGELDTDGVSKTDAREFALKLAYEHPEMVAALMEDEGYSELD